MGETSGSSEPNPLARAFGEKHQGLEASGQTASYELQKASEKKIPLEKRPDMAPLFSEGSECDANVAEASRDFMREIAPVNIYTYQAYMNANARTDIAYKVASHLMSQGTEQINPFMLKTATQLREIRDVLALSQSEGRKDVLIRALFREWKINPELIAAMPITTSLVDKIKRCDTSDDALDTVPIEQQVILFSQLAGTYKYDEEGLPQGLLTYDEALENYIAGLKAPQETPDAFKKETHQTQQLKDFIERWPSEKLAITPEIEGKMRTFFNALKSRFNEKGLAPEKIQDAYITERLSMPLKVVIFDIGGVAHEGPSGKPMIEAYARMYNRDPGQLGKDWEALMTGYHQGFYDEQTMTTAFFKKVFGDRKPTEKDVEGFNNVFRLSLHPEMDPKLLEIIKQCKEKGLTVVAHTDTTPPHLRVTRGAGMFDKFDEAYNSIEIGGKKTDPRDHLIIAADQNVPPERCLLVDDGKENIENAERAGVHGLHVTTKSEDPDNLRDVMERIHEIKSSSLPIAVTEN